MSASHDQRLIEQANARCRELEAERDELRAQVDDQRARYESLQRYLDKLAPIADAARVLIVQITPGEPCPDPDCNACRFFAACAAYDEHLAEVDAGFKRWMDEEAPRIVRPSRLPAPPPLEIRRESDGMLVDARGHCAEDEDDCNCECKRGRCGHEGRR